MGPVDVFLCIKLSLAFTAVIAYKSQLLLQIFRFSQRCEMRYKLWQNKKFYVIQRFFVSFWSEITEFHWNDLWSLGTLDFLLLSSILQYLVKSSALERILVTSFLNRDFVHSKVLFMIKFQFTIRNIKNGRECKWRYRNIWSSGLKL